MTRDIAIENARRWKAEKLAAWLIERDITPEVVAVMPLSAWAELAAIFGKSCPSEETRALVLKKVVVAAHEKAVAKAAV